jgi:hypothetical protein
MSILHDDVLGRNACGLLPTQAELDAKLRSYLGPDPESL